MNKITQKSRRDVSIMLFDSFNFIFFDLNVFLFYRKDSLFRLLLII